METNEPLKNLLGLARKAGKLEPGGVAAREAVRHRRAKLVLLSADLSRRTAETVGMEAENAGVRVSALPFGMDETEAAIGKKAGVIAVNDEGFARALLKLMNAADRGGNSL